MALLGGKDGGKSVVPGGLGDGFKISASVKVAIANGTVTEGEIGIAVALESDALSMEAGIKYYWPERDGAMLTGTGKFKINVAGGG